MSLRFTDQKKVCWIIVFSLATLGMAGEIPKVKKLAANPGSIGVANQRLTEGDILLARKEYYPALLKYLEAGKLNPDSEITFNKLGITYSQLLLNREAIHALNRAIALNKRYAYAYNNLGSVYFAQRELGRAEKNFKKAIKLKPDVASFHYNLGAVYFEKKKFKQGEKEYRRALELDRGIFLREDSISLKAPTESLNNPERHYYLARIYASLQNVEKTIEALQAAANLGFKVVEAVEKEPIFEPLRKDKRFADFIEDLRVLQSIGQWK